MGQIILDLAEDLERRIERLVEKGEYASKEEATNDLIRIGLSVKGRRPSIIPPKVPPKEPLRPTPPERWPEHFQ
ncbi:MAG: hypothetical protein KKI07_04105 [Euryarchaeota archaeon]|nr:hypothetical protein [Euryarchaeota archaeon]